MILRITSERPCRVKTSTSLPTAWADWSRESTSSKLSRVPVEPQGSIEFKKSLLLAHRIMVRTSSHWQLEILSGKYFDHYWRKYGAVPLVGQRSTTSRLDHRSSTDLT